MKTSTLLFRIVVSMLFLAQAFYSIAIGVPLLGEQNPIWIVWLLGLFLGFYGAYTVGRYHELEHIQEKTAENSERWLDELRHMYSFIRNVVRQEHVDARFRRLKEDFAAACQSQVEFYVKSEKELAQALQQSSDDKAIEVYESKRAFLKKEERLIASDVCSDKKAFWDFHELVGKIDRSISGLEFVLTRPDSIQLEEASTGGQVTGEEVAEY